MLGDDRMRFRWPKRSAFLLCPPKMDPTKNVLTVLPSCFVVNVSGLREINTIFFFFGTPWVYWCGEYSVSGFTTFTPCCDESSIQHGCQIERTSSMEYKLQEMMWVHQDPLFSFISSTGEPSSASFQPFFCRPRFPIKTIPVFNYNQQTDIPNSILPMGVRTNSFERNHWIFNVRP